jgi:hypothetical protein
MTVKPRNPILDLIVGAEGSTQIGAFQIGSVTYTQRGYETPTPAIAPEALEFAKPEFANVTPQLQAYAQPEPPRFQDGTMADPHGNLTNLAAQGIEDDNRVIVIDVAGEEASEG